jgi:hypothetical protein
VTVCVAGLAGGGTVVVGVSDRMLTGGGGLVEFEPEKSKIVALSNSIALMWAGDSFLQAEVIGRLLSWVGVRIRKEPTRWLTVSDVALGYATERQRSSQIRS